MELVEQHGGRVRVEVEVHARAVNQRIDFAVVEHLRQIITSP